VPADRTRETALAVDAIATINEGKVTLIESDVPLVERKVTLAEGPRLPARATPRSTTARCP